LQKEVGYIVRCLCYNGSNATWVHGIVRYNIGNMVLESRKEVDTIRFITFCRCRNNIPPHTKLMYDRNKISAIHKAKPIPLLPSENATLIITIPNTVNPAPRNIL